VAIVVGTGLYLFFAFVPGMEPVASELGPIIDVVFPLSVFATLFVTFSKVDFHLMHLCRWHGAVLAAQLLIVGLMTLLIVLPRCLQWPCAEWLSFRALLPALLTCVIAPCASASPVVTAKLGGNLTSMTTFVLLSSLVMAVLIPAVFPLVEPAHDIRFFEAFLAILQKMAAVLLLPLFLGAVVRIGAHYNVRFLTSVYKKIVRTPDLGFYCWSFSLAITAGVTVRNIVHSQASLALLAAIAFFSFLITIVQFAIGRGIGHRMGALVESGQAMFQKNTALAIWVAYMFLSPVSSIGAGCYVLWQNIVNSYELWMHRKAVSGKPQPPKPHSPQGA